MYLLESSNNETKGDRILLSSSSLTTVSSPSRPMVAGSQIVLLCRSSGSRPASNHSWTLTSNNSSLDMNAPWVGDNDDADSAQHRRTHNHRRANHHHHRANHYNHDDSNQQRLTMAAPSNNVSNFNDDSFQPLWRLPIQELVNCFLSQDSRV